MSAAFSGAIPWPNRVVPCPAFRPLHAGELSQRDNCHLTASEGWKSSRCEDERRVQRRNTLAESCGSMPCVPPAARGRVVAARQLLPDRVRGVEILALRG